MERFIPFDKLSKKERRKQNRARRGDWGALNPVTRREKNPRAYDRRKAQSWKKESGPVLFSFTFLSTAGDSGSGGRGEAPRPGAAAA